MADFTDSEKVHTHTLFIESFTGLKANRSVLLTNVDNHFNKNEEEGIKQEITERNE